MLHTTEVAWWTADKLVPKSIMILCVATAVPTFYVCNDLGRRSIKVCGRPSSEGSISHRPISDSFYQVSVLCKPIWSLSRKIESAPAVPQPWLDVCSISTYGYWAKYKQVCAKQQGIYPQAHSTFTAELHGPKTQLRAVKDATETRYDISNVEVASAQRCNSPPSRGKYRDKWANIGH